MSTRLVTTLGNDILTTPSQSVSDVPSDRLRELAQDMIDTMHAKDGIGIAAPQIGVSERVIVVNAADGELVLINPELKKHSLRKEDGEEGCLSIPGVFGIVPRYKTVSVNALTLDGTSITIEGDGLLARVLQHEIDHINGILFISRAKKITKGADKLEGHT